MDLEWTFADYDTKQVQDFVPVTQEMVDDAVATGELGSNLGPWLDRRLRWAQYGIDPWPDAGFSPHLVDARVRAREMRFEDDVCPECRCDGSCR